MTGLPIGYRGRGLSPAVRLRYRDRPCIGSWKQPGDLFESWKSGENAARPRALFERSPNPLSAGAIVQGGTALHGAWVRPPVLAIDTPLSRAPAHGLAGEPRGGAAVAGRRTADVEKRRSGEAEK